MTHIPSPRAIIGTYLLAANALSAAMLLSMSIGGPFGGSTVRVGSAIAGVLVLGGTFVWGNRRGFQVRDSSGRISITYICRNLVMSVIMAGAVLFAVGQVVFWSIRMTR